MYCFKCGQKNDESFVACKKCKTKLSDFYSMASKLCEKAIQKSEECYKSKQYIEFICYRLLLLWYRSISSAVTGSLQSNDFPSLASFFEYKKVAKTFGYLGKEKQVEEFKNKLLSYFNNRKEILLKLFEISEYYQDPFKWKNKPPNRLDPESFKEGESNQQRLIRLLASDHEFIVNYQKLMNSDINRFLKDEVAPILM